ncbi:phosphatidic acid phosphatase type 2/haloperoxidase [Microdochium bolleyi]|uniref:Phosphatidic acid phosphatase type 2/haloperoxidase n=1 Tax=Microdochium bolleyi TaxID=196109 RepID=A0A136ISS6_9PEZI|nr:phosphatidic acid phosphatase type 2/haloperoxidase [Microdochium bolleyi]
MDRFRRQPAATATGPNHTVDGPVNTGHGHGHHSDKTKHSRGGHHSDKHQARYYSMASRPTFGQWLKHTWLDILTMACMGAIGLGVYMAPPAPNRSFAVTFADGEIVYPQFAYPMRKEIIPIVAAAVLAAFIPIFVILIMQIRVRSFWDVNNGIIGLLYSLITAAVFQVFIKWLIGGLRPHFLDACRPDLSKLSVAQRRDIYDGTGYKQLYYTKDICTGDMKEINDSLESMPSGHTTAAFAGFVYLYFYLNAKLKVFANHHPAMWKLVLIYMPILGAVLIGGALTIDEYHNWYDVFAGAVIGTVFAWSSYRMVYAAVWDWRYNHIPLHRNIPFRYDGSDDLSDAVFTHKAGWGENTGGAAAAAGMGASGHGAGGHTFGHRHNGSGAASGGTANVGHGHHGSHGGVNRVPVGSRRSHDIV